MDDVAAHAGVGVGTVYRRFTNRDELIEGIFVEHLNTVRTHLQASLDNPDSWDGLVDLLTFMGQTMAADRGLAAIMMRIDHTAPVIEAAKEKMTQGMQDVIERARASGVIRPDFAPTDMFLMFNMVCTCADITETTVPGAWRRSLEMLLDSMRADGRRVPLTTPPLTVEQIHAAQSARCRTR